MPRRPRKYLFVGLPLFSLLIGAGLGLWLAETWQRDTVPDVSALTATDASIRRLAIGQLQSQPSSLEAIVPELWTPIAESGGDVALDLITLLDAHVQTMPAQLRGAIILQLASHELGGAAAVRVARSTMAIPFDPDDARLAESVRLLAERAESARLAIELAAALGAAHRTVPAADLLARIDDGHDWRALVTALAQVHTDRSDIAGVNIPDALRDASIVTALLSAQSVAADSKLLAEPLAIEDGSIYRAVLLASYATAEVQATLRSAWRTSLAEDTRRAWALLSAWSGQDAAALEQALAAEDAPDVRTVYALALEAIRGAPTPLGHRATGATLGAHADILFLRLAAGDPSALAALVRSTPAPIDPVGTVDLMLLLRRFAPSLAERAGWPASGAPEDIAEHRRRVDAIWMVTPLVFDRTARQFVGADDTMPMP